MNRPSKRFYEFDSFRIDVEERQLLRGGAPVLLTPKVFDVLLALVENCGHTLGKDMLMERVWANTFVEDGNLNRNISTLRKVLGDDRHKPLFIKTLPKRGYRFDGDVREIVEDDEELIVHRRTNLRIAMKAVRETRRHWASVTKIRFLLLAVPLAALLIVAILWALALTQTNVADAERELKRGTQNAEAFELYEAGRALWQNRSVEGLHQATFNLEQAVERDPEFALAHAALADAYAFDGGLWTKAEASANEAIRLDPGLGQPFATIGFVRMFWQWKLREAEPYFKQAVALSPDYATAHQWYSLNLAATAQVGASVAEMRQALELEPDSLAINADMCQILYFARKFDQAIKQCRKTLEMDPNFLNAHTYLYDVYTAKGMYAEAVAAFFKCEELNMTAGAYPGQLDNLKNAYAAGGIRAFWRARIEMLKKPIQTAGYQLGQYHARLGEHDEAIRWFRRAYENRDFDLVFLVADPAHIDLAADPRYTELAELLAASGR